MPFFEWLHRLFVPSHQNSYRPHMLRRQALLLFLGVIVTAEGVLVANLLARQSGHDFLAAVIQSEIFSLTNTERLQNGVAELTENPLLDASAQAKANDMAAKGYFAHKSPDGSEPWRWIEEAGYEYQVAGENLAVRFVDSKDVMVAWMASPTHRANVVKPSYTEIGIGIAEGMYQGQPATYVVQHFGKPLAKATVAAPTPKPAAPAVQTPAPRSQVEVLGAEAETAPPAAEEAAPTPVSEVISTPAPAPAAPPASFSDSLARQLGRMLSEPRETTAWVLGIVTAVLVLALAFAFFHHIQLQAHDLLVPGALVAGIALMLMVVNAKFLLYSGEDQSASVLLSQTSGVMLTPEAASDTR